MPTQTAVVDTRHLWRPKFPEGPQCASCPFRVGNNKEFGAVVARLRIAEGIKGAPTKADVGFARMSLVYETQKNGDFMCHCSVYDADMKKRPATEWRQCAGATKYYKTGLLSKE